MEQYKPRKFVAFIFKLIGVGNYSRRLMHVLILLGLFIIALIFEILEHTLVRNIFLAIASKILFLIVILGMIAAWINNSDLKKWKNDHPGFDIF